ncbi:NAD-dependent epimerase/dehydratase family protein [Paenibacillus sp. LHD-38]|uniref:NAD-dependent epimerase/dehydratase family protein n=1 Tax=Paenibacillus sp. LHD-38 TaxID=3072143 RepID=UPI0028108220|nr:NAD-dependent epimerase/dehydratase family protein [Paenibacillus sp. LHD-38]MDQ8736790.1 NAD-dependent epimerase/dehydratase family protein [Paenibacillus sp. LHD-38]
MKIMVLGGTGHISGSIVARLLEKGHEVTCFNRGKSGDVPDGVNVIVGDRRDKSTFISKMRKERFDAVIDMISFTEEDALTSIEAFRDVGQFVQCSTVCTYGIDYDCLPVPEEHPLRPISGYGRGKALADQALLQAHRQDGFPVTIIKPSTTYGPRSGMLRQVAWDFSWIDRIRKGKPILLCGEGKAIHQFLHVSDAAKGFAGVLGKPHCIGQVYHLVNPALVTWEEYHRTAMKVLNREVETVGVELDTLLAIDPDRFDICREIFAHDTYYSAQKLLRDVPEFVPTQSLEEGMRQVFDAMEREGRIPDSDSESWEDLIIDGCHSERIRRF